MRCPSMPINPAQPVFNALSTIDFKGIALSETRYKNNAKLPFVTADEPVPSAPKFPERPCTRWSASEENSLGAEDNDEGGGNRQIGFIDYAPLELQENPWSGRERGSVSKAAKTGKAVSSAEVKQKLEAKLKKAAPPPPSKKK